jgi:hypothetical protein
MLSPKCVGFPNICHWAFWTVIVIDKVTVPFANHLTVKPFGPHCLGFGPKHARVHHRKTGRNLHCARSIWSLSMI